MLPGWCSGSTWGRGGWFQLGRGWLGGGLSVGEDWEFGGCVTTKPGWGDSDKAEARGEGMGEQGGAGGTGTVAERTETGAGD